MLDEHAIVCADDRGVIRLWSAGAEAMFGYPAPAAIGRSLDLIIPAEYRIYHWTAFFAAVASGVNHYERKVFADPIVHADGSVVHHRGRFTLLKDAEARVVGVVSIWDPPRPDDQTRRGPTVVSEDPVTSLG